ncbi:MAG: hypothetical protein JW795_04375 [Chitinivibrionales bacterium]|nr:hypothetical protein [Chitinivibrionales bacterium]
MNREGSILLTDKECSWRQLSALAVGISVLYLLLTYTPGFLLGYGSFWDLQVGDVSTHLTGMRYYIRDAWRFPLFYVDTLNYPDGSNIIFTDSLPLMAFVAKVIYKLTGLEWNYFGYWVILTNLLYGLSIVSLLRSLNIRNSCLSLAALLIGFAVFSYVSCQRCVVIALSSHFLIIFSLSLYFYTQSSSRHKKFLLYFLLLMVLSLLIHFYLFAEVFLVAVAALLTLYVHKKISVKNGFIYIGLSILVILVVMVCTGYLSLEKDKVFSSLGSAGKYQMDILSPLVSGNSSLCSLPFLNSTPPHFLGSGNYLGISVILLCLIVVIKYPKPILKAVQRYSPLFLLCTGLYFYSLSNKIYFASRLIFEIPLVPGVESLYKIFQATSRFFWPVIYLLTFTTPILLWKKSSSKNTLFVFLLLLAIIQNVEIWNLRRKTRADTSISFQIEHLNQYEEMTEKHELILVSNKNAISPGHYRDVVRSFYYLTGKYDTLINYCYTARQLRQVTPLEEMIESYADSELAVLVIVPQGSSYMEWLRTFPFSQTRDGILFASNRDALFHE